LRASELRASEDGQTLQPITLTVTAVWGKPYRMALGLTLGGLGEMGAFTRHHGWLDLLKRAKAIFYYFEKSRQKGSSLTRFFSFFSFAKSSGFDNEDNTKERFLENSFVFTLRKS
jgi:hypothetical protein